MLLRVVALTAVMLTLQSKASLKAGALHREPANVPAVLLMATRDHAPACKVTELWRIKGGVGSATQAPLGVFQTDGAEGTTMRSFKDQYTGLVINVGVDFVFEYSKPEPRPYQIDLGISVSRQESDDTWLTADNSEASTLYRKNWNLSVTKNVWVDDRFWIYTLHCWDRSMPRTY
jgi:hypothetical protein